MRYFNTTGPCNREEHYMVEPSTRLKGVEQLIAMEQYFVIHAAPQSGKTTYLHDLASRINAEGRYYAIRCSLENMQHITDPREGIPEIVRTIKKTLEEQNIPHGSEFAKNPDYDNFTDVLNHELTLFCRILDKPLVILFDEMDCLQDDTRISFLAQLRMGYNERSRSSFVSSIALAGMSNIRNYKTRIRPDGTSWSPVPFNIVTKTYTLQNFTKEEIRGLYLQHTEETGQRFEESAVDTVYEQTLGQPWLVNAIAREVIEETLQLDYSRPVTKELVEEAIQTIILRRDTHIDNLFKRLKEERVRRVIEPMIIGGEEQVEEASDDYRYAIELGLIRSEPGTTVPANPIYAEVIARSLSAKYQKRITARTPADYLIPRYLKNGRIDMEFLMKDFQQFRRENSDIWKERFDYLEAAPHLILMAFLQRVINGGGQIHREMAAGTGRLDLCIVYENEKYPVELKLRYGPSTVVKGLEQTARYIDSYGCNEGWLLIFDRRDTDSWNDKIFMRKETVNGKTITIVGL